MLRQRILYFKRYFILQKKGEFYEKKRLEYEARQKAIRDHDIMMKTAKRLGLEAGIAEGREKGIAEGREQEKRNIIREMLQDHIPDYKIKQYTGATDKEISEEKSRLF